jgi:Fe-S oxidoreductase/nitrate reductase gamma subunit
MNHVTRIILGNVPTWLVVAFYIAAFAACGFAVYRFVRRFMQYRQSRATRKMPHPIGPSLRHVLDYLAFHRQLRRDPYAGAAHMMMFYGFVILFIGTCLVALEHDTPLHFFYGWFYLIASLIIDLGGVAFIVGLSMFAWRRFGRSGGRILRQWWVAAVVLLLLAIGVTGFMLEAARIAVDMPAFEKWSAVGYTLAMVMRGVGIAGDRAATAHQWLWATHAVLCVAFFALLPFGFFGHMVFGAVSWAVRSTGPRSRLRLPQNEPGAANWRDMTWRDLLHADACTTCGRCNDVCPAAAAGKPLRPREVVLGLRAAMDDGDRALPTFIPDEMTWACTTCGACNQACPVGIDVYDKIVDVRRGRVESGEVPQAAEKVFERSNPFGKPDDERMNWAVGMDVPVAEENEPVELLYWIGCAGSFDPEGRSVSRAMVRILNHMGVSYRVLGKRERCNGDPARRMGEEGLFQSQAAEVIDLLASHGVKRILTHCPHCFNTFRNEYPELGGRFEVEHHSQFLARMIDEGRLQLPAGTSQTITFHDPCYLGRGNNETDAPRRVLKSLPQLNVVEMPRHGVDSFCCGAGGGSVWLDTPGERRVENLRAAEAVATGAQVIATGCPFCKGMLEAGRQSLDGADVQVKDLAELVARAQGLGL